MKTPQFFYIFHGFSLTVLANAQYNEKRCFQTSKETRLYL